ncbi:hypothetical protein EDEG_02323 [Edhazardia aedis USNM 41457]|uniref:Uncharacterized protein n=1 Tax=Edhazardia aedis (strain USNM 41457) TaxID=1003232 RepID=J9D6B2_EDHAE|nr:hypothetical protein EDEG_02323 [Edhazardia aedis USNM 41457]|eukprot:EJW03336.1 hypothetical protein EDEG_02323 [Edhazardia aedis USNM 41457]
MRIANLILGFFFSTITLSIYYSSLKNNSEICFPENKNNYICAKEPKTRFRDGDKSWVLAKKKPFKVTLIKSNEDSSEFQIKRKKPRGLPEPSRPLIAPFPMVLPPCLPYPPFMAMQRGFAPCPALLPPPPKRNIFIILESILVQKKNELVAVITNRSKNFIEAVKTGLSDIKAALEIQISAANNQLIKTLGNLFTADQQAMAERVFATITSNNSNLMSSLTTLTSTANAAIQQNISALITAGSAAITAAINDLTTAAGTLQQMLAITAAITDGFISSSAQYAKAQTAAINKMFAEQFQTLSAPFTDAINNNNTSIQSMFSAAAGQATTYIVSLFNALLGDFTILIEAIVNEYRNETDRSILNYFSCEP